MASDCVVALGAIITDDYLAFIESKYAAMALATTAGVRVGYFEYPDVTMRDFMVALLERFGRARRIRSPPWPHPSRELRSVGGQ